MRTLDNPCRLFDCRRHEHVQRYQGFPVEPPSSIPVVSRGLFWRGGKRASRPRPSRRACRVPLFRLHIHKARYLRNTQSLSHCHSTSPPLSLPFPLDSQSQHPLYCCAAQHSALSPSLTIQSSPPTPSPSIPIQYHRFRPVFHCLTCSFSPLAPYSLYNSNHGAS